MTVIKTVNLKDEYIDFEGSLKVSKEFFEKNSHAQAIKNDILVSSTGYISIGKIDVYPRDEKSLVDAHIAIIRLKEKYDPYFIAF